jgi:tRNA(fMet)-specific endonuclease VapC
MLVLDTDVLSHLQYESIPATRIRERIRQSGQSDAATIVSFEEQMRGWTAYCAKARTVQQYSDATKRLKKCFDAYVGRTILEFDERAAIEFERLKSAKIRIGTMDLRIAAIALANNATLITANLRDFSKVPGLRIEDWTSA